ncbi:4-(cytidine 5'-diphospho)-2-C-methyl-D-erythritol kinase [Dictyobacter arantiisoli]|uniref:4-diphosphocytidyl-2-C-methyl-D-erythritol kinase n=1 Tax=Dictyobacter arantiisoli TaxID=2014874 RepID=A0A5A5T6R8_9CHLR|nr:4-(cytidine 5'-diphospho)-2-C-methyl-D-erythritol kinase [Dictyobacter arantiisoli]GCF07087.1 4-diphosphocytidyl-2-C-methyl-D-erythritol kinase [Dictyobacter arantiisoli]
MSQSQHATQHNFTSGNVCFVQSYAKINLTLDVLGKRPDGYHELATLMQTIDLYDTICLSRIDEDRVDMVCNVPELSNENNLVIHAAQAIRQKLGLRQGLAIELHKRIPVAAGLGGGSSNAAAVLQALQQWWQLPLSQDDLWQMAADLGSDVPFFLTGGLALCEGRGEKIVPQVANLPEAWRWLLLVKPAIGVSTATVFRQLTASDYSTGSWSRAVQAALQNQQPLFSSDLHNCLERGVLEQYAEVAQARAAVLHAGASNVRLSGSGPSLFSFFPTLTEAALVQHQLQTQGYEVYLTRALTTDGSPIHFFH